LSEYIQTSFIIIDLGLVTESQLGLEVPHKINETFSNLLNNKSEMLMKIHFTNGQIENSINADCIKISKKLTGNMVRPLSL